MKKVLYLDFMHYTGHVRSNKNFIKALEVFYKVYVLTQADYFDEYCTELEGKETIEMIKKDNLELSTGQLSNRISSWKVMLISALQSKKIKPDYIFVSSFDTIAFRFGRFLFGNTENMYILHTINTDELFNKVKRKIFDRYKNKVNHVVFEHYMKEHLVKNMGVKEDKVFVLPHPLNSNLENENKEIEYACVGLSNSNNEALIDKLIKYEQENSVLKKNLKKVVLKSKEKEFDNGYLKVVKGFLDKDVYDNYINKAKCILVPFPEDFKYRMSGTLVDAFSNNKIVLGNNIDIIRTYSKKYPNICKVFANESEVVEYICFSNSNENLNNEFEKFKKEHSQKELEKSFNNMFEKK